MTQVYEVIYDTPNVSGLSESSILHLSICHIVTILFLFAFSVGNKPVCYNLATNKEQLYCGFFFVLLLLLLGAKLFSQVNTGMFFRQL